ncbi:MAG: hypothetical protein HOK20_03475 [Alphaproteobacteria bacterium]|nr:hypothetical protein [Alphaproteobacteria bacterium]
MKQKYLKLSFFILRFLAAILLVCTAFAVLLVGRLAWGPLDLSYFAPAIEQSLQSKINPYNLSVSGITLTYADYEHPVNIHLEEVHVKEETETVLHIPNMTVSLNFFKIFVGQIDAEEVEILRPSIRLKYQKGAVEIDSQYSFEDIYPLVIKTLNIFTVLNLRQGTLDLYDDELGELQVKNFQVSLYKSDSRSSNIGFDIKGNDGKIDSPNHFARPQTLDLFGGSGLISPEKITIDSFSISLSGVQILLEGSLDWKYSSLHQEPMFSLNADVSLKDVPVNDLESLWPKQLGRNAREWVTENLSKGIIPSAHVHLQGAVEDLTLSGGIQFKGTTVSYIKGMPPVENVDGVCDFTHEQFKIHATSGDVSGLHVTGGEILLTDLSEEDQDADITLDIEGPLKKVLKFINHDPLNYVDKLGLKTDAFEGDANASLNLRFPLLQKLSLGDIKLHAQAKLLEASYQISIQNKDHKFTSQSLDLDVTTERLLLTGDGNINNAAVSLSWEEVFSSDSPFTTQLKLSGRISHRDFAEFGVNLSPYIEGMMGAEVSYIKTSPEAASINAKLDLMRSRVNIEPLVWEKSIGIPGEAEIEVTLKQGGFSALPRFVLSGGGATIQGKAFFDEASKLDSASFIFLKAGAGELNGALKKESDGQYTISCKGDLLNLGPFMEGEGESDMFASMRVTLDVQKLQFGGEGALGSVKGLAVRSKGYWTQVDLFGLLPDAETSKPAKFEIKFLPTKKEDGQTLTINADDGGAFLSALNFTDSVVGGTLEVKGERHSVDYKTPLTGTIQLEDFKVVDEPILAKVLSMVSLSGLLNILTGSGVPFSMSEITFEAQEDVFKISEGYAKGSSIGITLAGTIDRKTDQLKLSGSVAPAYMFSALVKKIPLIGPILTGGEGEGFLGFNYAIGGEKGDPSVSVNPLSVLAPGIFKKVFDGGDE